MSKNKNSMAWSLFDRYLIQGLNGMALGLFSTLIIGLIIKQISGIFTGGIATFLLTVAIVAMFPNWSSHWYRGCQRPKVS